MPIDGTVTVKGPTLERHFGGPSAGGWTVGHAERVLSPPVDRSRSSVPAHISPLIRWETMRSRTTLGMLSGLAIGAAALTTSDAQAHFRLEAPAVMTEQNNLGDPQKAYACGGGADAALTGDVTAYTAGDTITITIDETIYHPGHYRVALATGDVSELPPSPVVTPTDQDDCAMTEIMNPPVYPVLADGMLLHDSAFDGPQSFEVTLPEDVSCENCTLQILEFMSMHGAPCFYYHCATISIAPSEGGDTSGGAQTTGEPTTGDPTGPDTTGDPTGESTTAGASDSNGETSDGPAPASTGGDTPVATGTDGSADPSGDDDGGGCSVGGSGAGGLLALLPMFAFSRRRRGTPGSSLRRPPSSR